jgi:hypothetical protein
MPRVKLIPTRLDDQNADKPDSDLSGGEAPRLDAQIQPASLPLPPFLTEVPRPVHAVARGAWLMKGCQR